MYLVPRFQAANVSQVLSATFCKQRLYGLIVGARLATAATLNRSPPTKTTYKLSEKDKSASVAWACLHALVETLTLGLRSSPISARTQKNNTLNLTHLAPFTTWPSITCHTLLVWLIQGPRLLGIFISSSLRGHYTQSRGMVPSLKHETRRAF